MDQFSADNIRIALFMAFFAVIAAVEHLWPRRELTVPKRQRWQTNIGIIALDTVLVRLLIPILPVGMASFARTHGWGLFNLLPLPVWLELLLSILALDLVIYLQHRAFHRVPLLWRFHRVHHTDLDIDASTGNRFHPVEIIMSIMIKCAAIVTLGSSPVAVLIFEILLNATSLFSHANLGIPLSIDRWLRLFLVTPDMHRVHHSVIPTETDSNFGFNLPWWDRLLHSYRSQPAKGHYDMTIGLTSYRNLQDLGLGNLLLIPFRAAKKSNRA